MDYDTLLKAVQAGQSLPEAFRGCLGMSSAEIAAVVGASPTSIHQCLTGQRENLGLRRAIEAEFGLPVYAIENLLDLTGERDGENE